MASTHSPRVPVSVRRLATAVMAALTIANTAQPANAVPDYLTAFETQYPAAVGSRIDMCTLCHTTVPALNPYGMAFANAGHEFAPIESQDSDGDGFTNLAEIMALTFPGDPADTPAPAPSPTPTDTPLPVATPTDTAAANNTPTNTAAANNTPTVTPSGAAAQTPTNTSGGATGTPTRTSGSPGTTPTVTPSRGSATGSPTASAVRTATGAVPTTSASAARTATRGGFRPSDDDACNIVAPGRTSSGGGLILLLAPALLLWARRRRL